MDAIDALQPASLKRLSPEQLSHYRAHGYLHPLPALREAETAFARSSLEAFEAHNGGHWPRDMTLKAHYIFPFLDDIVHHPAILDVVEDIVGPDILCWSSRLFIKDPHDGGFVSWQQDVPYWGLDIAENILSVWVGLSPATRANGVMKVIPGSHKSLVPHREGVSNNLLLRGQEVAVDVDERQAVYMELGAGEFSVHHGLMFHASEENHGSERRIGFAIRYMPTRVRALEGLPRDNVMLVRGVDRYGHFDLAPRPSGERVPQDVARFKQACATYAMINRMAVQLHDRMVGRS